MKSVVSFGILIAALTMIGCFGPGTSSSIQVCSFNATYVLDLASSGPVDSTSDFSVLAAADLTYSGTCDFNDQDDVAFSASREGNAITAAVTLGLGISIDLNVTGGSTPHTLTSTYDDSNCFGTELTEESFVEGTLDTDTDTLTFVIKGEVKSGC